MAQVYLGDQYTDVLLTIKVSPHNSLHLEDNDVVCEKEISLLDAIQGATVPVPTIDGFQMIDIIPLSKNKDEVIIPNLGVNKTGNQRVRLNVSYPDNIDALVELLKNTIVSKENSIMAVQMPCPNCKKTCEPCLNPKTGEVYCSACSQKITVNHFVLQQLKALSNMVK